MKISPIFAIDGYKTSHRDQYPENTEYVYGNFTPRYNHYFKSPFFKSGSPVIWAGAQAFLLQWFVDEFKENFFDLPKEQIVPEFKKFTDSYLGKDSVSEDGIAALHDLGYLPLRIKSIPEGSAVMIGTPVLTLMNTLPQFGWVSIFVETLISAELWPVATAATIAFNYRCIGTYWAEKTCDDKNHIPYQFHDFSSRGDMGMWASTLIGMGHLMSFLGTDSVFAYKRTEVQYPSKGPVGASIPATEHSVMCMGTKEGERDTIKRLLTEVYPSGIFAAVVDAWDFWKVITETVPSLKAEIMARDGKFVIRPDSGDPVEILCGRFILDYNNCTHLGEVQTKAASDKDAEKAVISYRGEYFEYSKTGLKVVPEHEVKGLIQVLWETFGGTVNSKGFKVLDPHIGAVYGDSITMERAEEIFSRLARKNFASSNIVLGIGSYTYQYVTRDTFGFAMKATWGIVGGEERNLFKDPATGDGSKKSVKGLVRHDVDKAGNWSFTDEASLKEESYESKLPTIFLDGKVVNPTSLNEIRSRIDSLVEMAVDIKLGFSGK